MYYKKHNNMMMFGLFKSKKNSSVISQEWSEKASRLGKKYGVLIENNGRFDLPQGYLGTLIAKCKKEITQNPEKLFDSEPPFIWMVSFDALGKYLTPKTYEENDIIFFTQELLDKMRNHMIHSALSYNILQGSISSNLSIRQEINDKLRNRLSDYLKNNDFSEYDSTVLVSLTIDLIKEELTAFKNASPDLAYFLYPMIHTFLQLDGWFEIFKE